MAPLYADISSFQTVSSWPDYVAWAKQWDGIARILLRSSQGVGVPDTSFEQFWSNAIANGIDRIGVYHYCYPNLHSGSAGAIAEADYFASVVGSRLRPGDWLMMDLEQNEQGAWALAFGQRLRAHYPETPIWLYDSLSHIQQYFKNPALASLFQLNVADWTLDPNARPACPSPWASYVSLQFSDRYDVPGIGPCDCNVWLGETAMSVPQGWTDNATTETLTAPNGQSVQYGFRKFVLASNWQADNTPFGPDYAVGSNPLDRRQDFRCCSLLYTSADEHIFYAPVGQELKDCQAQPPPPASDPKAAAAKAALKAWLAE